MLLHVVGKTCREELLPAQLGKRWLPVVPEGLCFTLAEERLQRRKPGFTEDSKSIWIFCAAKCNPTYPLCCMIIVRFNMYAICR